MHYRPHTVTLQGLAGVCAADRASEYLARKDSAEQTRRERLAQGAAGSPLLADTLAKIDQIGRLQAEVVANVTELTATGEAEQVTQLPLPMWLSMVGRMTRRESNLLLNAVDVLADMPNVAAALQAGEVAWGQITVMIGRLRGIRSDVRRKVDDALAEFLEPQQAWEPDELVQRIDRLIDAATPDREQADADAATDSEFLHLQPDLFGHKGRLYGELGTPRWSGLPTSSTPSPTRSAPRCQARLVRGWVNVLTAAESPKPSRSAGRRRWVRGCSTRRLGARATTTAAPARQWICA